MPRARKRCAKAGCREYAPCSVHRGWQGYRKGEAKGLPSDWKTLRTKARNFHTKICYLCSRRDPAGQVDHIIPRSRGGAEHPSNYAWICQACHKEKTDAEKR